MPQGVIDKQTTLNDLRVFAGFIEREGLPPTVREFQDAAELSSTSVAQYHLNRLRWAGLIERRTDGLGSRNWKLTAQGRTEMEIV